MVMARNPAPARHARSRLRALAHRERDDEDRAPVLARALRAHGAAVKLDDVLHQREAEPEAAVRARARAVALAERLEDVRNELRRDPDARVGDDDLDARLGARETHAHAAARRRELDRVREQVPDDLLQTIG